MRIQDDRARADGLTRWVPKSGRRNPASGMAQCQRSVPR